MSKFTGSFDPGGYATVAERVRLFWERYPNGRINTDLKLRTPDEVVFVARVYRDAADREPSATGWAAEREGDGDINLVACLENTETSAVGRALANLGFTASTQRPSAEEMTKASRMRVMLTRKGKREVSSAPLTRVVETPSSDEEGEQPTGVGAPTVFIESVPALTPALTDFLRLLARAERAGLVRALRAARWRVELRSAAQEQIEPLERRLRARLVRAGA